MLLTFYAVVNSLCIGLHRVSKWDFRLSSFVG